MKLVCAEVGTRCSADGYSVFELLERRAGWGLQVGGGGRCVVNPDLRVLLHVDRDFRAEAFRLSWECGVPQVNLVDTVYFRYDGVEDAAQLCFADVLWHARPAFFKAVVSVGMGWAVGWRG